MQIISRDKIVRNNTVQGLNGSNSQSLATRVKKGEQVFSMMLAIEKAFDLLGYDILQISTDN